MEGLSLEVRPYWTAGVACGQCRGMHAAQALLRGVSDAVAAHSSAADRCEAVVQLPSAGVPSQLCDLAHASLARAASAQVPPSANH